VIGRNGLIIVLLCALAPVVLVGLAVPLWAAAALVKLPRRNFWRAWLATILGFIVGGGVTAVIGAPLTGLIPIVGAILAFLLEALVEVGLIVWVYSCRFWPAAGAWLISSVLDWAVTGLVLLAVGGSLVAFLVSHGIHLPDFHFLP